MGDFIKNCLRYSLFLFVKKGTLLGRQRSAISVAAYLISKHKMTPHDACKYIMDKRKEAFHYGQSLNFDQALDKYHKQLQKKK